MAITAQITVGDSVEQVKAFHASFQEIYLFLPGGIELSQVRLYGSQQIQYTINGRPLTEEGISCESMVLDMPYPVTIEYLGVSVDGSLTFLRPDAVPALMVDVRSGNMDHIHAEKGNLETGSLRLYEADGTCSHRLAIQAINGRGNSTWEMPKKSYSMELALSADLLEMGSAKKWILTSNSMDPSNLRNKLVFDFANRAELPYSPECRWVNLYLNGEYAGLYLLSERNEVHTERVNIAGTGGFLVSRDFPWRLRDQGRDYITTDSGAALRIHHCEMSREAVTELWQSAENAILAEDGVDPVTGKSWEDLIDVDSWARKYLLEELFANTDGAVLSQYFYYDGTGKICAGPVWDYDLTMGNQMTVPDKGVHALYANQEQVHGGAWYGELYKKEAFINNVVRIYETEFRPLLQQLLHQEFASYGKTLQTAAVMNDLRWFAGQENGDISQLKDYLLQRMAFLDKLWLTDTVHHKVRITAKNGYVYHYLVEDGKPLPQLEHYESDETTTCYGWFYEDTQAPVDPEKPVHGDTRIYFKYESVLPQQDQTAAVPESQKPVSKVLLLPVLLLMGMVPVMASIEAIRRKGGLHRP